MPFQDRSTTFLFDHWIVTSKLYAFKNLEATIQLNLSAKHI